MLISFGRTEQYKHQQGVAINRELYVWNFGDGTIRQHIKNGDLEAYVEKVFVTVWDGNYFRDQFTRAYEYAAEIPCSEYKCMFQYEKNGAGCKNCKRNPELFVKDDEA